MNKYSTEFMHFLVSIIGTENSALMTQEFVDVYLEDDNLILIFRQPDVTNQDGYHHWEEKHAVNADQKDKLIHIGRVLEF
jgi:hypothetical protein